MQVCERCLLNDNIPSVRINSSGICNYCTASSEPALQQYAVEEEFSALLEKNRDRRYQVIMAYSGGKDSSYILKLLKEKYGASVLAVTFDNCFLSESCLKNIRAVTNHLGIDSIVVKYPESKLVKAFRFIEDGKVFPMTSLERASAICNLCIMLIKNLIYQEAIIREIPVICFGWTPGQVETAKPLIKLDYRMVLKGFDRIRSAIGKELGCEYDSYFLREEFVKDQEQKFPYLYYPFVRNEYNEKKLLEEIRSIGWEPPENTDGNSSNCLLNSYANQCHVERFGYHPYAFEISNLVRKGCMSREEGAGKLEQVKNDTTFERIRRKFEAEETTDGTGVV